MGILLWAELRKLRRSNIIFFMFFVTVLLALIVFISGKTTVYDEQFTIGTAGWYMTMGQVWATMVVIPALIALLGSYMICREDQDDTMKSLRLVPVNEAKLTAAKMTVTFGFSILIYLLLFIITFLTEAALHFSELSAGIMLRFLKMYLLEGVGAFLAVSPMIAIAPYLKKSYWLAFVLAEIYSFAGMFMSMSDISKTFYPITAIFGVSGYYDTAMKNWLCSVSVLILCGGLSFLLLCGLNRNRKRNL